MATLTLSKRNHGSKSTTVPSSLGISSSAYPLRLGWDQTSRNTNETKEIVSLSNRQRQPDITDPEGLSVEMFQHRATHLYKLKNSVIRYQSQLYSVPFRIIPTPPGFHQQTGTKNVSNSSALFVRFENGQLSVQIQVRNRSTDILQLAELHRMCYDSGFSYADVQLARMPLDDWKDISAREQNAPNSAKIFPRQVKQRRRFFPTCCSFFIGHNCDFPVFLPECISLHAPWIYL